MSKNQHEISENRTEITETENFGHLLGLRYQITEISSVSSVLGLG
jgi:hypothetical protein